MTVRTSSPAACARAASSARPGRGDDKLVARQNQFRRDAFPCAVVGILEQTLAPLPFRREHSAGLRTSMMSHGSVEPMSVAVCSSVEIDLEKSRAPEFAFVIVAAGLLGPVNDLVNLRGAIVKRGRVTAEPHPKAPEFPSRGDNLVAIVRCTELVRFGQWQIDAVFVMPEMERGPQLEPGRFPIPSDPVADVDRILQVRHQDAFLDHQIAHLINPDGQPVLEPEFLEVIRAFQIELAAGALFRA